MAILTPFKCCLCHSSYHLNYLNLDLIFSKVRAEDSLSCCFHTFGSYIVLAFICYMMIAQVHLFLVKRMGLVKHKQIIGYNELDYYKKGFTTAAILYCVVACYGS